MPCPHDPLRPLLHLLPAPLPDPLPRVAAGPPLQAGAMGETAALDGRRDLRDRAHPGGAHPQSTPATDRHARADGAHPRRARIALATPERPPVSWTGPGIVVPPARPRRHPWLLYRLRHPSPRSVVPIAPALCRGAARPHCAGLCHRRFRPPGDAGRAHSPSPRGGFALGFLLLPAGCRRLPRGSARHLDPHALPAPLRGASRRGKGSETFGSGAPRDSARVARASRPGVFSVAAADSERAQRASRVS